MSELPLKIAPQVSDYIAALPPETKKRVKAELKKLSASGGDTHGLRPPLERYSHLRTGDHRIIYEHVAPSTIACLFAGDRATVYQDFQPPAGGK